MYMSFNEILKKYRIHSNSERYKGTKFEVLIKSFLKTYQLYKDKFCNIYLWDDFPFKDQFGNQDNGIDIVCKTYNNEYWAVQCKCYQENDYIDKEGVDSFLSTSSKSFIDENNNNIKFSYRLFISTSNNWSNKAEEVIKNQIIPVIRLNLIDLENAEVDWDELDKGISGEKARLNKKEPREHQIKAINCAKEYFKTKDRGKLIMACGTGKTFTSLKIAEMLQQEKMLMFGSPLSLSLNINTLIAYF